jgi:hypothetical protein
MEVQVESQDFGIFQEFLQPRQKEAFEARSGGPGRKPILWRQGAEPSPFSSAFSNQTAETLAARSGGPGRKLRLRHFQVLFQPRLPRLWRQGVKVQVERT